MNPCNIWYCRQWGNLCSNLNCLGKYIAALDYTLMGCKLENILFLYPLALTAHIGKEVLWGQLASSHASPM